MKIGILTDTHYSSALLTCGRRRNSLSLEKIRDAFSLFAREACNIIVFLGDLTDFEASHELEIAHLKEIRDVITLSNIPCKCLMGNHDSFAMTPEEFYGILDRCKPENTVIDGKQLIFLDACYFKSGVHYAPGDDDWTDTYLPNEEKLCQDIASHPGESVIFIHQNIDPNIQEDHRICNSSSVFDLINESGKVKHVFQGHFHAGMTSEHGNVTYHTLKAVCENDDAYYIFEI